MITIQEISKQVNLSTSAIRYYEKRKLLTPNRNDNGYRIFSNANILELKYITILKYIGLSINEIQQFMSLLQNTDCFSDSSNILNKKVIELNNIIQKKQHIVTLINQLNVILDSSTEHRKNNLITLCINDIFNELIKQV